MTSETPEIQAIAAAIAELSELDDIDRARAARRLAMSLPTHLAAVGDEAVYAATREMSNLTVAGRLGVSVKAVERGVAAHRRRYRITDPRVRHSG